MGHTKAASAAFLLINSTMKINEITSLEVIDILEEGAKYLSQVLEEKIDLVESSNGWETIQSLLSRISTETPTIGKSYSALNLLILPPGKMIIEQGHKQPLALTNITNAQGYTQYEFEYNNQIIRYPDDYRAGDQLSKTFLYNNPSELEKIQEFIELSLVGWDIRNKFRE